MVLRNHEVDEIATRMSVCEEREQMAQPRRRKTTIEKS
jgi:hypothetical protein